MRFLLFSSLLLLAGTSRAAAPEITVAYPPPNSTVAFDHVIFEGHVTPGASLTLNGRALPVGPDGLFMEWLPLKAGKNALKLLSTLGSERRAATFNVTFSGPSVLPAKPTAIKAGTLTPGQPLMFYTRVPEEGRTLSLGFQGSPGGQAWATITGLGRFALPEQTAGRYRLDLTLPENTELTGASIKLSLSGKDGRTVVATAPGTLTFRPGGAARVAEVSVPDVGVGVNPSPSALASGSGATDWLFPRQGQRLEVLADLGRTWLVRGPGGLATARKDALTLLPPGTPLPDAAAGEPQLIDMPGEWLVRVPIRQRTVFDLSEPTAPAEPQAGLSLLIANAAQPAGERHPDGGPQLSWAAEGTALRLTLTLPQPQLWGYFAEYQDAALLLHVRKAPPLDPAQPLRGRLIVLDPGHGGSELGGAGSLGQPEKNIVLPIALRVAELLRAQGADVRLTRSSDVTVGLYDRPLLAERLGADLLISIHANALPDGIDPRFRRGLEVHTFHPMTFGLAGALVRSLTAAVPGLSVTPAAPLGVPGLRLSDLALARPTSQRSVLIELAYLTQAGDLRLLMGGLGREAFARGIAQGIADDYAAQAQAGLTLPQAAPVAVPAGAPVNSPTQP
ncbi:N-acetylmuramoyl-L-alanine amidase [Deinococcus irradiatisoli]|uniref:N-acetylmuramoyl-L-alanine amidase n=1 Tax=Deinococcus irradiatisoli TaxID=2202254 RepID=A0A2Z3JEP8_9DEIO|nr:N-acetylmuramoyl-L-alanine amidase [Deinococcus irradiatisoli]AWN23445.1 N-acetylmuramoyl-L-alanine amidase [Deinococcus irradiatisoli]